MDSTKEHVQLRLFLGLLLPVDLKIALDHSRDWKSQLVTREHTPEALVIVREQGKEYIGRCLDHQMLTVKQLQLEEEKIRTQLIHYTPDRDLSKLECAVFPQVFVS